MSKKKLLPHTVGRKTFLLQEIPIWLTQLKAGFHMIATIAGNNVRQSWRSCGNHFFAIVTIKAIIWKPVYINNCLAIKDLPTAQLLIFGSDHSDHMETSLDVICYRLMKDFSI